MAAILDRYGLRSVDNVESRTYITQNVTANTWYDTGIDKSDGAYANLYVLIAGLNSYNSGTGSMYSTEFVTVPIHWNTTSVNSVSACELRYGVITGHAPNSWQDGYDFDTGLRFRVKHEYSNGQNGWRIQYMFTMNATFDSSTGKSFHLYLRRVG